MRAVDLSKNIFILFSNMNFLFFVLIYNVVQTQMGICGLMPLIIYHINVIFKNKTQQKALSVVAKEVFPRLITSVKDDRIVQQLFNYLW